MKVKESENEVTQFCLILCNPMVHGILQARVVQWVVNKRV